MKPVKIPGNAAGKTTLLIVCHLLAPRPYDASLTELGTALIASWLATIITGKISSDIVRAAANTLLPKPAAPTNNV